jgi:UDP-N-acetylmuramoyl-tripeptide--D-alanyl-D-alanine ligase
MANLLLLLLILTWLIGSWVRVYRQARFYQIEEYMSPRYARWLLKDRERYLPAKPLIAGFLGAAIGIFLGEAPGSVLPHIIGVIAGIIAVIPPDEGEIKKKFVRTQRATRLLATAFVLATLTSLILLALAQPIGNQIEDARVPLVTLAGLGVFLAAPLFLMLGNIVMIPVEAFFRQRFINRAKNVMAAIHPKVIGITGSYGKTTTKNFLRDILNGRYKTYATPKSYNTMMGICLAINNDMANDYSIEYMISEMGAYIPDEIERICTLTPPEISIVVEVGPQHLERFGSLENIAIAKYEIIKALPPHGLGIFNVDNPYVRQMYERGYPQNRIGISKTLPPETTAPEQARFIASNITETLNGLSFAVTDTLTGANEFFTTPVVGEHNILNILLATAVAVHEGMSLKEVARRVRVLQPAESRLVRQVTDAGITIINDAYSANPAGVVSALKVLALHTSGKRLLITPGMVELGDLHEPENHKLGTLAAQVATDVILIGAQQTAPIHAGLTSVGFPPEHLQVMATLTEAINWYKSHLKTGDTVLFLNDLPDTY